MAMLRLAVSGKTPLIFDPAQRGDAPELSPAIARAAAPALRKSQPLVVMVHGYKFDPYDPNAANPHEYLYHFDLERAVADRWQRPASWPAGLGFRERDPWGIDGLCVGFAWSSRPNQRMGAFCRAYQEAGNAGRALLQTLESLAEAYPARDIDIFVHSLGARVALTALRVAARRGRVDVLERVGRVLLLGPAELASVARDTMEAIEHAAPARKPEIYSVVARENDFFDVLVERFAPKIKGVTPICVGSHGMGEDFGGWLDLQLDSPALQEWLAARGVVIGGGPPRKVCHWGVYNRPGALDLYADILRNRPRWSISAMQAEGVPTEQEQRWASLPKPRFFSRKHPSKNAVNTQALS
jgi:pimeloyl-ACP methyl ester carboxylesterase